MEPKIKYYFGVKGVSFKDAEEKLERIRTDWLFIRLMPGHPNFGMK